MSGREVEAAKGVAEAKEYLRLAAVGMAGKARPRVVYVVGKSPLSIVGGGTFMGEMVEMAGGENVGATVGNSYPMIGNETLSKLSPDVLLISAPGEPEQVQNDVRLEPWLRLPIPAAWNKRVYLVTDGNAMMASLELPKQVQELAGMIHRGEVAGNVVGGKP